jgi:LPS export ABC transporter protein LptC
MISWRSIYKLHDKLINVLVIIVLSLLCLAFDKLTNVNLMVLNFKKAQYFLNSYHTKLSIYSHGHIKYIISADNMQLQSDINRFKCFHCYFIQYDELNHKISMSLVSDKAQYDIDQQILVADGHLHLSTFAQNQQNNINAFTDHVTIKTAINTVYGNNYINIVQNNNSLSGIGFNIDYNKKIMNLHSHVKLSYTQGDNK